MRRKSCTQCKQTKPLKDFYLLLDRGKYRYKSACKECTKKYVNNRRRKKPSRKKDPFYVEYQRMYYRTHREQFRRYRKEFITKHPNYFKERYALRKQQQEDLKSALTEGDLND